MTTNKCLETSNTNWEMLTGASKALVKNTKKGNYIVIIVLKTV